MSDRKVNIQIDVLSIGEMKSSNRKENLKESFIELAGKVAFLHQAQDSRYATLCIRVLGKDVIFMLFDRGGSLSTQAIHMHASPELFLHILLRVTFVPRTTLGFDSTVHEVKNKTRDIEVTLISRNTTINVNELLFISGSLHSRGTTVWSGTLTLSGETQDVVVKDLFIDPL